VHACVLLFGLCGAMTLAEAKRYHAYARECLRLAEAADKADDREKLIELSRLWMKVALREERLVLESRAAKPAA
jgi:hypothetical protein